MDLRNKGGKGIPENIMDGNKVIAFQSSGEVLCRYDIGDNQNDPAGNKGKKQKFEILFQRVFFAPRTDKKYDHDPGQRYGGRFGQQSKESKYCGKYGTAIECKS